MLPIILASSSPARLKLLAQIGITPSKIIKPDIDETPIPGMLPKQLSQHMAMAKMQAILPQIEQEVVITCDSVAACGRRVLEKSDDTEQNRKYLQLIGGRRHRIYSTVVVAIIKNGQTTIRYKTATTILKFKRFTNREIEEYLASKEGFNKAGGYCVDGMAGKYLISIIGSYSNIVGLPLYELQCLFDGIIPTLTLK